MTRRTARPAPLGYRAAVQWIAVNDDTAWVHEEYGIPSVTAALVADLHHRTEAELLADLKRALAKEETSA